MFAVVKSGGRQFKAELGTILELEKLEGVLGDKLELEVLFSGEGENVALGAGTSKVIGEIVKQGKGEKVLVFKKRRRHNYRRKNGHRQFLTTVQIVEIGGKQLPAADVKVFKGKPIRLTPSAKDAAAARTAARLQDAVNEPAQPKKAKAASAAKTAKKAGSANTSAKPESKHTTTKNSSAGANKAAPRRTTTTTAKKGD